MSATIGEALRFPFKRVKRLFYWLWVLIPVIGWLAFSGYIVRIIQFIIKGKYKEAPKFGKFWHNFVLGAYAWAVGIVIGVVITPFTYLRMTNSVFGIIAYYAVTIYVALVGPIMVVQLAETESLARAFNVVRAHRIVFGNFSKYIVVVLQQIVVSLVLLIASIPIITIIFTFPAMSYSKYYLYARFYRDLKKKPKY